MTKMIITNSNFYPRIKRCNPCSKTLQYAYQTAAKFDIFFKANKDKDYLDYSFVRESDVPFFNNLTDTYPNISKKSILDKLEKISSMDRLEWHNKMNLVEHVITKEIKGETRDFDKLIDNIKYFSKNKALNSVLIADSSKYALEESSANTKEFNEILTYVVNNSKLKDAASIIKISKLILSEPEKKDMLLSFAQRGFGAAQIKFIATTPDLITKKLMLKDKISDLNTDEKFEYFKLLNSANTEIFTPETKTIFPNFPSSKKEAEKLKESLKTEFLQNTPFVLKNVENLEKEQLPTKLNNSDKAVLNICVSILKNNKPSKNEKIKTFYEQKAFQSIYELKKYNLNFEQQNKIYKILNASGKILDTQEPFSSSDIALNLRYRNTFEIFDILHSQILKSGVNEKLNLIKHDINKLKSNTNIIPYDNFDNEQYSIKEFPDGTINKIIEYDLDTKNNPKLMLHSAGIEVAGLLPIANSNKTEELLNFNSNKIFSASFLNSNDYKPFRTYGFIFDYDFENILGGSKFDLGSGRDKTIENFGVECLKNNSSTLSYFPNLIKTKYALSDKSYQKLCEQALNNDKQTIEFMKNCENLIDSQERIDERKYNEFFICNPTINGIFSYGNIEDLPFEFRKFAQENDLKILHIKTRKNCNKDIQF